MQAIIGTKLLSSSLTRHAKAGGRKAQPFEVCDKRLQGFILRVQPSGVRSYYAQIGRGRRIAIGKVGQFTPDEARRRCE